MLRFLKGRQEAVHRPSAAADNRVSFELQDDDENPRNKYSRKPFDFPNQEVQELSSIPELDQLYISWREAHPDILANADAFFGHIQDKRLAIFLDYDGTLTPIVSNPDEATMSDEMRQTVRQLAQLFPTGIISGRGREKVENFVQLSELYYAGSHGMDIAGPQSTSGEPDAVRFQPAASFAPLMDEVYHQLLDRLKDVPGASVEHNKFCISAHFRNCAAEDWRRVEGVVADTLALHQDLKTTKGRKVLEIRPQVDWDKGKALDHLLQVLGLKRQEDVVAIYIGDDTTDEDAFRVLRATDSGEDAAPADAVHEAAAVDDADADADAGKVAGPVHEAATAAEADTAPGATGTAAEASAAHQADTAHEAAQLPHQPATPAGTDSADCSSGLPWGFGILVSTKVKETAAAYTLQEPGEVQRFLQLLVDWGKGSGNAWFRNPTCLGWKQSYQPVPPLPALPQAATAAPAVAS